MVSSTSNCRDEEGFRSHFMGDLGPIRIGSKHCLTKTKRSAINIALRFVYLLRRFAAFTTESDKLPFMGKVGCLCGRSIVDSTDDLPYKADIVRDQQWASVYESLRDALISYVTAMNSDKRSEWIAAHFGESYAGQQLSDEHVIEMIVQRYLSDETLLAYQCPWCGRVLIESRNPNHFYSFQPETDDAQDVFAIESQPQNES